MKEKTYKILFFTLGYTAIILLFFYFYLPEANYEGFSFSSKISLYSLEFVLFLVYLIPETFGELILEVIVILITFFSLKAIYPHLIPKSIKK